jgi:hypothetical protein
VRRGAVARCRRPDGLTSTVVGLRRLPIAGVAEGSGGDAFGHWAATPFVTSEPADAVPFGEVFAAAVVLAGAGQQGRLPAVTVTAADDGASLVRIDWPDGERDDVPLPAPPR